VGRRCGSAHAERLPPRTHEMNPLRGFVQQSLPGAAPRLRVDHSPSPAALMPVLSISKCSAPKLGRQEMVAVSSLCRRHKVPKSGPGQVGVASFRRLATSAVACRRAQANSARRATGRSGSQRPRRWPGSRAAHSGQLANPSQDQTT
jgi:hypothetical protein